VHQPLHSLLVAMPAVLLRCPRLVINFHGHDLIPVTRRGRLLRRLLAPFFSGRARVLVPSERFKAVFDQRYPRRPGGPSTVFRSGGISSSYLGPAPSLGERGSSALFLSRWVEDKGWRDFLALARLLLARTPDFRFTLAGIGPDETLIRDALRKADLEHAVHLIVSTTPEENRTLYRSHRYFVFPTAFDESLALVNLEAMACGCVVLSSDFPAAAEYLLPGVNGFLLERAKFVEDAITVVAQLENQPVRAQSIADQAALTSVAFDEAVIMRRLPMLLGLRESA
jgi:glycosyltransferase involved in cell wall biosynthesis